MPIGRELAAATSASGSSPPEILDRVPVAGYVVIADKNFAGTEFEQLMADRGGALPAPRRAVVRLIAQRRGHPPAGV
jgi:hypothetical protein